jgi:hypothetical protein
VPQTRKSDRNWVALDAETKLVPCWFIGTRDWAVAYHFIDLAGRLAHRVQLTTDAHKAYLNAVEGAFGADVDFAQLIKIYGNVPENGEVRYSPAVCMGARIAGVSGNPDYAHVSTSYVERQNRILRCEWECADLPASRTPFQERSRITKPRLPLTTCIIISPGFTRLCA